MLRFPSNSSELYVHPTNILTTRINKREEKRQEESTFVDKILSLD